MELRDSPAEAAFRQEVRAWLNDTVPTLPDKPDPTDWPARRAYDTRWQAMLYEAGYAGVNWPKEYGGLGATPGEHLVFLEESARAGAPDVGVNFVGLLHGGPTLILEGRPDQQAEHLPRILRGETVWCQGFSEPEAGSDLASLRTRAVRDGDDYVVTGQKIWTSFAMVADYCELLVRTDPDAPKHRGISWLIMPMDAPGIEVRPLRTVEGTEEFAELFLDEVRIPVANRVGEENDGWRVAQTTFSFERGTSLVSEMLDAMGLVADLTRLARRVTRRSGTAWDDAGLRREVGMVAAELDGLWALTKRNVTQAGRGALSVAGGSAFKLVYADVLHRLGDLAVRILDRASLSLEDLPVTAGGAPERTGAQVHSDLHALAMSIAAGTSQIQRNILAEKVLGLPREPR
ncbi:MAG TPA: acyl-CoA dehydrogenase family protein [Acidimicrobiales bacterium]